MFVTVPLISVGTICRHPCVLLHPWIVTPSRAPSHEPLQLIDQLDQVVTLARSTLSRRLELKLPELTDSDAVIVQSDPARLRQVLLDLIENAAKYSPNERPSGTWTTQFRYAPIGD